MNETFIKAQYFKAKLNQVRRKVGRGLTYLSFLQEGDKFFFKANLLNAEGAKDKLLVAITGPLENLEQEDYDELSSILISRGYVS